MESVSKQIAKKFIARAAECAKPKGVKRDREALEFVCGAAAACEAIAANNTGVAAINAGESAKQLAWVAFMVATRGYSFLEETASADDNAPANEPPKPAPLPRKGKGKR